MYDIIKKPLKTEKSTACAESGTYVFKVSLKATKPQIRRAIEEGFGVQVAQVRTLVGRGRWLKKYARWGPPRYWKKAYVKLKQGQKISSLEGAQ